MISNILFVGFGGALGAISRFGINEVIERHLINSSSYSVLLVNVIGCFLIGMVLALVDAKSQLFLFLTIGILGSFTTMSAFSAQALDLLLDEKYLLATSYVFLTLLSCIISTLIAYYLFKALV